MRPQTGLARSHRERTCLSEALGAHRVAGVERVGGDRVNAGRERFRRDVVIDDLAGSVERGGLCGRYAVWQQNAKIKWGLRGSRRRNREKVDRRDKRRATSKKVSSEHPNFPSLH